MGKTWGRENLFILYEVFKKWLNTRKNLTFNTSKTKASRSNIAVVPNTFYPKRISFIIV